MIGEFIFCALIILIQGHNTLALKTDFNKKLTDLINNCKS